ncbi:MAG: hypothetical protein ACOZFS_01370 [Thermodesulfobacteriota bacterium]
MRTISQMITGVFQAGLMMLLGLTLTACAPKTVTPPPLTWPSEVVSREGVAFSVHKLRIPGTFQEIKLKEGGSEIWVPLDQVVGIRFAGPIKDLYRPAYIVLTSGDIIKGDLFVDFLLEGTTDLGYWNIPMSRVERLEIGTD